jgi:hypothetical protein
MPVNIIEKSISGYIDSVSEPNTNIIPKIEVFAKDNGSTKDFQSNVINISSFFTNRFQTDSIGKISVPETVSRFWSSDNW